jgi:DNA polymerase-1
MTYETRHLYYTIEKKMLDMWGGDWVVSCTPRSKKVTCKPSINFNSSDQVIPLIESLGFEITERTKKKKKSFGKLAKKRLAGQHEFIDLLIKFGKVEKLLSSFLEPLEEYVNEDGRIRCSFHNTVAVTGRLSCSSPNLEQLPKQNDIANIRNLFIASNNNVYIVADYSGQELRVLGEESQDPALKKAFADGLDLHQVHADTMGFTGDGARDKAKPISFGIPYGKEAYGFSRDWNCSIEEAQIYLDKYFAKYPRVKTRIERCKLGVYKNCYVTNMSGRKRRFPNFHNMNVWQQKRCYRQAFNFLIQSFSADMIKIAAAAVIKNLNLKLCNLVHDEIVVECHKDYVNEGIKYIRECMINAVKMSISLEVDIGTGVRYGEAK